MKIRLKIFLSLILLSSFLCGCSNDKKQPDVTTPTNKSSAAITTEASMQAPLSDTAETSPQGTEVTTALTNDNGVFATPIVITDQSGEQYFADRAPMSRDKLTAFGYEEMTEGKRKYYSELQESEYNESGYNYIKSLNDPELEEVFIRAKALAQICCNTEYFGSETDTKLPDENNCLYVYNESSPIKYDLFSETGINYDSFYNACCDVFTQDSVNKMLYETYPYYYAYNDELWVKIGSRTGAIWHSELETIKQTDTEVEFNLICYAPEGGWSDAYYRDAEGEWRQTEFDPEKRDVYKSGKIRNRFVKTEEGWKAEEIEIMGGSSLIGDQNFPEGFHDMEH